MNTREAKEKDIKVLWETRKIHVDKLNKRGVQIANLKYKIKELIKENQILKDVLGKKQDIINKLAKHPLLKNINNKAMGSYLNTL